MFDLSGWIRHSANARMGPLLVLSLILIAGILGGWVARRMRVPAVTGNILAGVLIGPTCLNLFSGMDITAALQPLSTFAMALIVVGIGSHLSYRRLHNAWRRVVYIAGLEVIGCFVLVLVCVRLLGTDWPTAFLLACISVNSSPATLVAVIRETRAKGTFVKTLAAVVGLDNMLCIMMFAFARTLLADYYIAGAVGILPALARTLAQLSGSVVLGLLLGFACERLVHRPNTHDFSTVFISVLLCVGVSTFFGFSPLLTALTFGIYLGNASEEASRQTSALEPIELLLFICFFTVAGVSLHLESVGEAGSLCAAYLGARFLGKYLGSRLGGRLAAASSRITSNVGLGLVPHAGVAIGLVVLLAGDERFPRDITEGLATVVLASVALAEIFGPSFARLSLSRAREVNKDRRRLIEFLQEEFILANFSAQDKWEALRKLTDFYARTHRLPSEWRESLYRTIEERERDDSTAIGSGAAIPHGRIEQGARIQGVLALSPHGIPWDSPDEKPVNIIMLVVTPSGYEREHLEVMASLSQMISDEAIRTRLVAAIDANDAWEIIESEESRNYNYFLDEAEGDSTEPGPAAPGRTA